MEAGTERGKVRRKKWMMSLGSLWKVNCFFPDHQLHHSRSYIKAKLGKQILLCHSFSGQSSRSSSLGFSGITRREWVFKPLPLHFKRKYEKKQENSYQKKCGYRWAGKWYTLGENGWWVKTLVYHFFIPKKFETENRKQESLSLVH